MIGGTGCTKHCQMSLLAKRLPAASFILFFGRERLLVSYRTSKRPWSWTSEPRHFTVICISSPSNRHSKNSFRNSKWYQLGILNQKSWFQVFSFISSTYRTHCVLRRLFPLDAWTKSVKPHGWKLRLWRVSRKLYGETTFRNRRSVTPRLANLHVHFRKMKLVTIVETSA